MLSRPGLTGRRGGVLELTRGAGWKRAGRAPVSIRAMEKKREG